MEVLEYMNGELAPYNNNQIEIITQEGINPMLRAPGSALDLSFYQTRETLLDPEKYRSFLKNAEHRFRASQEYKDYKSYLMSLGFTHCQIFGNIEASFDKGKQVDIELHHNILNLFDICIMITEHMLNTVGYISSFDLIQLLINEHRANNVGVVFLSTTAHQYFTNDPDAYIPPDMTFGKWWVLIRKYKYGVTYDIAQKIIRYIDKYQKQLPTTVNIPQQEEILQFSQYNQYGISEDQCRIISTNISNPMIEDRHFY